MKFLVAHSAVQRMQLEEIAKENGLTTEDETICFLVSEYRQKYKA